MNMLSILWNRLEEGFIVLIITLMTLVTFIYVMLNNLYGVFYYFGDLLATSSEKVADFFFNIGDVLLDLAQAMTWSNALTKALFAWLIFFGIAYGVRIGGHIGVDALVKLARPNKQRIIGLIACITCLAYAGLLTIASLEWITTLANANIGADDLGQYGIKQWHIGLIVPFGFAMVFLRYLQILYAIVRHGQIGLGLIDEAADAAKLSAADVAELNATETGKTP